MFTVYKHTCLTNGKAYVGWTSLSLEERWIQHCYFATYGSKYAFHRAIRKYGTDCWTHEVLEEHASAFEAKQAEVRLIAQHSTYTKDGCGYNMTLGGDGAPGYVPTLEQRIAHRGPNSATAKLTTLDVVNMKLAYLSGATQYELASQFGVKQSNVSRILRGITYVDIRLSEVDETRIQTLLSQRNREKRKFVKASTRSKVSINRSGAGNGMFGKTGELSPNFGSRRSKASRQLMREKALQREAKRREARETT
jgi:hypothetical protein